MFAHISKQMWRAASKKKKKKRKQGRSHQLYRLDVARLLRKTAATRRVTPTPTPTPTLCATDPETPSIA